MPSKSKAAEPDIAVSTADVAALTGAPAPTRAKTPAPFLSEGMRHDLETIGWAIDPISGARYSIDRETGEVTVTAKGATDSVTGEATAGEVSTVDVTVTVPATVTDPDTGETLVTNPVTGEVTAVDPLTGETRTVE